MIGTTFEHFVITGKLGEGGMGEVWQATDTRLDREVAIKLLPEDFDADSDRHARFEREAKLLGALNHSNVATLYGLEHLGDQHALVMELVPGQGLDERLAAGPLDVDETVAIARQIAEALEAAHQHGIIHRDLKPANIRVRPDGVVKVLDFGLARAWQSDGDGSDLSLSPTMTQNATLAGVILGTASYMAPEQARGKSVDRRADVWAFGVVLWEMLTGERLFQGETVTDVIAAVVTFDPDWQRLPPSTPAVLRRLLERCLRRDPRSRMPDIGACRLELEDFASGVSDDGLGLIENEPKIPTVRPSVPRSRGMVITGVLGLSATIAAAFFGHWYGLSGVDMPQVVFEVTAPEETSGFFLHPERPGAVVVSPDGSMLAYTAADDDGVRLFIRSLDSTEARAVPGTEGAQYPFWSPDSTEVGYFDGGAIRRVEIAGVGSPPVTICTTLEMKGASWSPEGVIVFAPDAGSGLVQVSQTGGEITPVTTLNDQRREDSHRHPRFLPDGRHFVYLARVLGGSSENLIMVGSLDGGPSKVILESMVAAEYASGHLLFLREGSLLAQPFDPQRLEFSGPPIALAEDVRIVAAGTAVGVFSASENGVLAYQRQNAGGNNRLVWRDRDGLEIGVLGDPARYFDVRLSPDGQSALVTLNPENSEFADVWIYDIQRDLRTRVTFDERDEWGAAWFPDSDQFVFASDRLGSYDLYRSSLGGSDSEQLLRESESIMFPTSVSADGRMLMYSETGGDNQRQGWNLMALDLESGEPVPFLATRAEENVGSFSPDGRWVVYHSTESGTFEVYLAPFPGPGRKWQVSSGGGMWPEWRADGQEIFYRTTSAIYAVPVETLDGTVEIGAPKRLFDIDSHATTNFQYSTGSDGQRFLVVESVEKSRTGSLVVEVNWPERLSEVRSARH